MPDGGVLAVLMVAGVVALLLFLVRLFMKKTSGQSKRDDDPMRRLPPFWL
jgi:hypothetical protein